MTAQKNRYLEGAAAVKAALTARSRDIECVYLHERRGDADTLFIKKLAAERGVNVVLAAADFLAQLTKGRAFGGALAVVGARKTMPLETLAAQSQWLVALEGVEDPYNLGYAVRALYAAGVDGLLLSRADWDQSDAIVSRASGGAFEHMPVAVPQSSGEAAEVMIDAGFSVVCAARGEKSISLYDAAWPNKLLLVVGGEKRGVSAAFLQKASLYVEIPYGRAFRGALPVMAAASIIGFEIMRKKSAARYD